MIKFGAMKKLIGTGVAVVTPFDAHHAVDHHALERVIEHLIAGKVEYLVALGTTGESVTLSSDEAFAVLDTFYKVNDGRLPIVIGVGGNNTRAICKRAQEVKARYNPDALLSVSPYYNKPTQEGIYQHYKALAEATDLSIILYNVPGRTASNIEAETVIRLATDFSSIVAVKEASGDLLQAMEIIAGRPEGFLVLSGDDQLGLAQIALGFDGVISVVGNAFPAQYSQMVRDALAGNIPAARVNNYKLRKLMAYNFEEGNPAGVKAAMALQAICRKDVRLPLVPASAALEAKIQKEMALL